MPSRAIRLARAPVVSVPANVTRPPVGRYMPVTQLNSVVLPAPFGPMTAVTEPGAIVNDTSSSAVSPPNRICSPEMSRSVLAHASSLSPR